MRIIGTGLIFSMFVLSVTFGVLIGAYLWR